jgi:hypothetical protein
VFLSCVVWNSSVSIIFLNNVSKFCLLIKKTPKSAVTFSRHSLWPVAAAAQWRREANWTESSPRAEIFLGADRGGDYKPVEILGAVHDVGVKSVMRVP